MTIEELIGFWLALLVMVIGTAGTVIPGIPSTPLILAAAVGHRLYFGEQSASLLILCILAGLTLLSVLLDYIATIYGAKRLGATWKGILGAVIGGIAGGIFFNLPGVILGPFVGAIALELLGGRTRGQAFRAGVGAMIGLLVGTVARVGCCVAMMGLFAWSVLAA